MHNRTTEQQIKARFLVAATEVLHSVDLILGVVCEVRMATSCTTEQQIKARFLVGLAVMVAAKCCLIAYLGFCVES